MLCCALQVMHLFESCMQSGKWDSGNCSTPQFRPYLSMDSKPMGKQMSFYPHPHASVPPQQRTSTTPTKPREANKMLLSSSTVSPLSASCSRKASTRMAMALLSLERDTLPSNTLNLKEVKWWFGHVVCELFVNTQVRWAAMAWSEKHCRQTSVPQGAQWDSTGKFLLACCTFKASQLLD